MSSEQLAEWLAARVETPEYMPAVDRQKLSDASKALKAASDEIRRAYEQGFEDGAASLSDRGEAITVESGWLEFTASDKQRCTECGGDPDEIHPHELGCSKAESDSADADSQEPSEQDLQDCASDNLLVAIPAYLRVCGKDLKHNNYMLLSESREKIAAMDRVLTALGKKLKVPPGDVPALLGAVDALTAATSQERDDG